MREYSLPAVRELKPSDHLVQLLIKHATEDPTLPLLSRKVDGAFTPMTAADVWAKVRAVGKGLIAQGVQAGDRVAIMSPTRVELTLADFAILAIGGATVPIYETSSAEQIQWILADSGAVFAFFSGKKLHALYEEVADRTPSVTQTVLFDEGALDWLAEQGASISDEEFDARLADVTIDNIAKIIYTSGTTGRPKGCVLTHGNLSSQLVNCQPLLGSLMQKGDTQLLFLPLAHSFANILVLIGIAQGTTIAYTDARSVLSDMEAEHPTFFAAVPRIFEKVHTGMEGKMHAAGGMKAKIFDQAGDVAIKYSTALEKGDVGLPLRLQHGLFDKLVYSKLREKMGGNLKGVVSGGGPLGARLGHFFVGADVPIYEGYGLTETSPVLTVNRPGERKIGTVGRPVPGTTVRIADDGEIIAKGPQIFRGYYNNPTATGDAIDADGWFHTGDIGEIDDEGYVRITGRKKELIVTAAGKNVAPAPLEDHIRAHKLVSQAMVVGDNRPFIGALITIDEETFPAWAAEHGKSGQSPAELVNDADLRAEIQNAINEANKSVSRAESVREFRIVPSDFTVEGGELTPTLKVKRNVVAAAYGDLIEDLYSGGKKG